MPTRQKIAADERIGLTVDEAFALMGIGRSKGYELINAGVLPARKLGKRTVILREDAIAALRSMPTMPVKAA